jgi:hypothetical protein
MSIRAGHESLDWHRRTGKDKFWGPYRQKQKPTKKGDLEWLRVIIFKENQMAPCNNKSTHNIHPKQYGVHLK